MITPSPPYYAVIFTSERTVADDELYGQFADRMVELAQSQPGFLGVESARGSDRVGITVSYWSSLDAIAAWHAHAEHREAQRLGKEKFYVWFRLRVAKVERQASFDA